MKVKEIKSFLYENTANMITITGSILASWLGFIVLANKNINDKIELICLLIVLIGLSDFLDGPVARRLKIESREGGILDRARDKIFICPLFIKFLMDIWVLEGIWLGLIKVLISSIVATEILLIVSSVVLYRQGIDISAGEAGRIKMFLYFLLVFCWIISILFAKGWLSAFNNLFDIIMVSMLFIATIFAILSFYGYVQRYEQWKKKIRAS